MGFYGVARGQAAFLNLGSFILMLLATLSAPVIKDFDFLFGRFPDGTVLKAGIWGYCTTLNGVRSCVGPKLGYTLDSTNFAGKTHDIIRNGVVDNQIIGRPLTIALIFYPLVTSLCFFAFLGALSTWRPISLLAVLQTVGAFGGVFVAWVISAVLFVQAHARLTQQFPPGTSGLGKAFYFGLGALIALFISQVAMFAGHIPSKEEKQKKRMPGKPGKRAPFGNVNWSDESLPMQDRDRTSSSSGFGRKSGKEYDRKLAGESDYSTERSSAPRSYRKDRSDFGAESEGGRSGKSYREEDGYEDDAYVGRKV